MKIFNAIVTKVQDNIKTKFDTYRSCLNFRAEDGTEGAIWAPAGHLPIVGRRRSERIVVGANSDGKGKVNYSLVENLSSGLSPNYEGSNQTNGQTQPQPQAQAQTKPQAIATTTKPQAIATTTKPQLGNQTKGVMPEDAVDRTIVRFASLMNKCRLQIINQMGIGDEDTIQKYATTLFIQLTRQLEQF